MHDLPNLREPIGDTWACGDRTNVGCDPVAQFGGHVSPAEKTDQPVKLEFRISGLDRRRNFRRDRRARFVRDSQEFDFPGVCQG